MTVLFCLILIYCGVRCALMLCYGSAIGALVYGSIAVLALVALIYKVKDDKKNKDNTNSMPNNNISQLKELKELLDSGAITQEEFDKQKKKLLN